LRIKPGLTGWAQIHGRTSLPWSERIELDLWYVEHRKPKTDLVIVWQTVLMLINGDGLYKGTTGGWHGPHDREEPV
jgi:lipopolysaccharide/colanic/teichoic acid biosynthesis glycosyltransferase